MRYVLCYDITKNRIRRKVAKFMEEYGFRIQKSVFECDLNAKDLKTLVQKAILLIDLRTDSLRVYPLCAACRVRSQFHGHQPIVQPGEALVL